MKREGRQHVKCTTTSRLCNKSSPFSSSTDLDMTPTNGVEPWTQMKPTNPWKHTGRCQGARCRSCHLHPISKSRNKAKGAKKLRSCDVSLNHRLVSWRVVDSDGGGMGYSGVSASGIVGYLSGYHHEEEEEEEAEVEEEEREMMMGEREDFGGNPFVESCDMGEEEEEEEIEVSGIGIEEEDDMGFCHVGIVWEYVDEEDWCVVGEM